MVNIAVAGANGRMGQSIVNLLSNDKQASLVCCLTRPQKNSRNDSGNGSSNGMYNNFNATFNTDMSTTPPDVLIDFSIKEAVVDHINLCLKHKVALVLGVTGLTDKENAALQKASLEIPIVYAPNMSVGVNISLKVLELLTQLVKDKAEIAIHEVHHKNKKDAPSGTALCMSETIQRVMKSFAPEEKPKNIPISSMRIGDVSGEHTVLFALPEEHIEITHKAASPRIFARGAILASKWIVNQKPGLYDMQDVLGCQVPGARHQG